MASDLKLGVPAITAVNDFVVKFANVNGSGSASANGLFAKSVLRMGVPASSRNIFPSNIQGLPTWYEVRISEAGHLGRRGGVDMMVAMNPETWDEDIAEIEPGGYLFYDSTKPMPPSKFRDDINVVGMPLTAICNKEFTDPRQRQLFSARLKDCFLKTACATGAGNLHASSRRRGARNTSSGEPNSRSNRAESREASPGVSAGREPREGSV